MEDFVGIFQEMNRQTLLLSGMARSFDAADEVDKLQKQIHATRRIFERDFELKSGLGSL